MQLYRRIEKVLGQTQDLLNHPAYRPNHLSEWSLIHFHPSRPRVIIKPISHQSIETSPRMTAEIKEGTGGSPMITTISGIRTRLLIEMVMPRTLQRTVETVAQRKASARIMAIPTQRIMLPPQAHLTGQVPVPRLARTVDEFRMTTQPLEDRLLTISIGSEMRTDPRWQKLLSIVAVMARVLQQLKLNRAISLVLNLTILMRGVRFQTDRRDGHYQTTTPPANILTIKM